MDHLNMQDRYEYLASRWRNKTISLEEETELLNWLNLQENSPINIPVSFAKSESALKQNIYKGISKHVRVSKQIIKMKLWSRIVVAASIVLVLSAGLYFFGNNSTYVNDVKPGTNKAILTLANGKRISLADVANGELAKEQGIIITKTEGGELIYNSVGKTSGTTAYNTLETPKGGQHQIILPDGTHIWLNAASVLRFPATFSGSKRRIVELNGEAYFEVAKDKKHPFIVKTAQQEVEVLGTHFEVNSYSDEGSTKTTLLEGSVKVIPLAKDKSPVVIKPGQQAILNDLLKITEVDVSKAVDWKNGEFIFDGEDLESIMRKVSRWYNVEVFYENDNLRKQPFAGKVSRFKNVSEVLDVLELTGFAHFKIEGRRIIVKK